MERGHDDTEIANAGLDTFELTARLHDLAADALVPVDLVVAGLRELGVDGGHIRIDQRTDPGRGRRVAGNGREIDGFLRSRGGRNGDGGCRSSRN